MIGNDTRTIAGILKSFCAIFGPLIVGIALLALIRWLHSKVLKALGWDIARPNVIETAEVEKPNIGNPLSLVSAGLWGLLLNRKRYRKSMQMALHSPYLYLLDVYDRFELRLQEGDVEGALRPMREICQPSVFASARKILYEAYSRQLTDEILFAEFKSWFGHRRLPIELRTAVEYFILEDYQACVRKFSAICVALSRNPEARKSYLRIIDLILSASAVGDSRWQTLRETFLSRFGSPEDSTRWRKF